MKLHFVRVPVVPFWRSFSARVASFVLALLVSAIVLALCGFDPVALGGQILRRTFGSSFGLEDLGLLYGPLILTGLAVSVALRSGLWNIGADGQFYIGGFFVTALGLHVTMPAAPMLVILFVAGALGGMAWIFLPALARAYARVDEIITTLLLNFVALLLVYYVSTGPWRDRVASSVNQATARVPYEIPNLHGALHWGFAVALIAPLLITLLLRYTRWGYEVRVSGANPEAAHYAGMPVRRRMVAVMLLSGALAGIAGMLEVTGTVHRLAGGISNNFGYLGIIVAVLARGNPLGVFVTAFLIAVLLNAGIVLKTQGLTTSAVLAVTGLIMLFTAVGDQLAHYRPVRTGATLAGAPAPLAARPAAEGG